MKKYVVILLTLSVVCGKIYAENSADDWRVGSEWLKEIQNDFAAGNYDDFLTQIEKEYQEGDFKESIFPAMSEVLREQKNEKLNKELKNLRTKTHRKLTRICRKHSDITLSHILRSAMSESDPDMEETKAVIQMLQDENDPLANKVRPIFEEYIYKTSLLNQSFSSEDFNEYRVRETVLHLEKWKKLEKAAQGQSGPLADYIHEQLQTFSEQRARIHDMDFLYGLSLHMITPKSEEERAVAKVMEDYLVQKMDVVKKFSGS